MCPCCPYARMVTILLVLRGNVACGTGLCNTFVKLRTCDYWLLWKGKKIKKPSGSLWAALGSLRGSFAETLGGNMGQDGAKMSQDGVNKAALCRSASSRWVLGGTKKKKEETLKKKEESRIKKIYIYKLPINRSSGAILIIVMLIIIHINK